ncbi:MAG: metallophosphoesterase [Desulfurococcales archaeon ex4484_58]|nr:MAG: metallophosphoesterase [Desulfurococcales archaeon ex4484_58]
MLKILATADIHSPRYLSLFMKSIEEIDEEPDLIIFAGDNVDKNNVYAFKPIYEYVMKNYDRKPVLSIFGNEEYRGFENKYIELYNGFKWLNNEYTVLEIAGYKVGVIGTRGALDKPTPWQARNIPGIYKYYRELPLTISKMFDMIRGKGVDIVILVSHYGVTYKNLEGEPEHIWAYLASKRFEEIIKSKKPDLVIHGHVHKGVKELVYIDHVPVYNVSLPARGKVVLIKYKLKPDSKREEISGLYKWLKKSGD